MCSLLKRVIAYGYILKVLISSVKKKKNLMHCFLNSLTEVLSPPSFSFYSILSFSRCSNFFCKGPDGKHFRLCGPYDSVSTTQLRS